MNYYKSVSFHDWEVAINQSVTHEDKFAKTFRAKANAMNLWPLAMGFFSEKDRLQAGIIVRINKTQPIANLQLLHTFGKYRRMGLARRLVRLQYEQLPDSITHYRVSSEIESLGFYRKLGFKFWGAQKSGCQLSIFKRNGPDIADGIYDPEDPVIKAAVHSKARGAVVEHFGVPG